MKKQEETAHDCVECGHAYTSSYMRELHTDDAADWVCLVCLERDVPARGTVVIHSVTASNDVLDDHNWDGIYMSVAVDWGNPECPEVVDGDISESLLEKRLRHVGWRVVSEDDAFVHDGTRWVRRDEVMYL